MSMFILMAGLHLPNILLQLVYQVHNAPVACLWTEQDSITSRSGLANSEFHETDTGFR
jgi:hypothetical protein